MALRIETSGESLLGRCPDCGNATRSVWGYVFTENSPRAVYFIRWTDGHRERGADLLLSFGGWGGGNQTERRAVAFACQIGDEGPGFRIVDADNVPWRDPKLGAPQERAKVVDTPLGAESFSILDAIVEGDPRFRAFLYGEEMARA